MANTIDKRRVGSIHLADSFLTYLYSWQSRSYLMPEESLYEIGPSRASTEGWRLKRPEFYLTAMGRNIIELDCRTARVI
jgi:hypothetical protein